MAGRQQLPEDVLSSTEPAILRTVAVSPNAAIDLRLEAAERAHAIGALSATALSQLYESVPFTEDELTNALSIAADDYGPRARALLYRAAQLQAVPTARAEVLQRTWELSRQAGDFHTVVKVNLPLLMELAPSAELTWFAGGAARSLYAAGSAAEAWRWFDLARRHAPVNAEAAAAAVALWPLSYLADPDGEPGWDEALLAAWWSQTRAKSTEAELRATLLYGLFAALGRNIDGVHWQPMLEIPSSNDGRLPAPALWHGLRTAAEAGRVGETVLYALIMLGDDGPAGSHPIVLYHVLANLRLAGLEGDARALALEAAIGAGL